MGLENLRGSGLNAKVISLPGHTEGSIGIITATGDLFCGDLLVGGKEPSINSFIDDMTEAKSSINKLKSRGIKTVYPGHGKPFPMDKLVSC